MFAFGGGHIEGAINIGSRPELSVWAGQMLDADRPILLVVEHENDLDWVISQLVFTGFVRFRGYLAGGMRAWMEAGYPLHQTPQISVHDLNEMLGETQLLDVRSPGEWQQGHIPGARHIYLAEMRDGLNGLGSLERDKPLAVYCGSGYRADIGASLLQARGFRKVSNVAGSWNAWTAAGYETEQ